MHRRPRVQCELTGCVVVHAPASSAAAEENDMHAQASLEAEFDVARTTGFLEERFHRSFEEELARFAGLIDRLGWRHGDSELATVRRAFDRLATRVRRHVSRQERELFPRLRDGLVADEETWADIDRAARDLFAGVAELQDCIALLPSPGIIERAFLSGLETFRRELDRYFTAERALSSRHRPTLVA
jgi:hypothetical protein